MTERLPRDWSWKHFFRLRGVRSYSSSPADRLIALFESQINATSILEQLHSCLETDPFEEAVERMTEAEFDVLGVRTDEGAIVGYVERGPRDFGTCLEHARPFLPGDLISESTPLFEVIAVLRDSLRVFVLGGPSIFGIITRADLEKGPVRIFVFGLISSLEMQLSDLLRDAYPEASWADSLSKKRLAAAEEVYSERLARNEQIGLFDCLQLCDKRDLLCGKEELFKRVGFASKSACTAFFKEVEGLRNRVAHGQGLASGSEWTEVIDLLEEIDLKLQAFS